MAKKVPYGGLWNKERFAWMEEEKAEFLRNLTIEESVKIFESLTKTLPLKNHFRIAWEDEDPVCLRLALKKHRK